LFSLSEREEGGREGGRKSVAIEQILARRENFVAANRKGGETEG